MTTEQDEKRFVSPQQRLREITSEISELDKAGVLDKAQEGRMAELITEGRSIRAQISQRAEARELLDYAGSSAGMLPLAAGNGGVPPAGQLQSLRAAGTTVLEHAAPRGDGQGSVRIAEQYGEGLPTDSKTWAAISSPEYREAFKSYMRTAMGGALSPAAIRTLQEGSDPSGGLAV